MIGGADYFERAFGSVTLRCDVVLSSAELFYSETGEVFAAYFGLDDLQSAIRAGRHSRDVLAALEHASEQIATRIEAHP
ncbi:MAG: hypothetical protein RH980_18320 [Roseovarius confluentis]